MPKVKLPLQGDIVAELPFAVAENLVKQGQATYVKDDDEGKVSLTVKRKKKKRKDLKGAPENKARR